MHAVSDEADPMAAAFMAAARMAASMAGDTTAAMDFPLVAGAARAR